MHILIRADIMVSIDRPPEHWLSLHGRNFSLNPGHELQIAGLGHDFINRAGSCRTWQAFRFKTNDHNEVAILFLRVITFAQQR